MHDSHIAAVDPGRRTVIRRAPILRATALVIAVAVLVGACGGDPAVPELTDPTEILQAAATTAATATAVHIGLTADGSLSFDVTGTGVGAPIELTDTTASVDLDLAGGDARATFAIPGLLGLRGELLVVDGTAWAKTSLTGARYLEFALGDALPGDPPATGAPTSTIAALTDFLARPELEPVKGADVDCGSTRCYGVSLELTADDVAALVGEATGTGGTGSGLPIPADLPFPIPDLGGVGLMLTVRVEKSTTRLAGLTATAAGEPAGAGVQRDLVLEVTFSKWDESVSISPPPADQVTDGG